MGRVTSVSEQARNKRGMLTTLFAAVGCLTVLKIVCSLLISLYQSSLPFYSFSKNKDQASYALITGASDGIGKEFALELAKKGYNLIIMARTESKLNQVAEIARESKVKVVVLPFDFATFDSSIVKATVEKYKISILVNNVGISHDIPTPFIEETDDMIQRIVNINILSVMKITKLVLPQMKKTGKGIIVNLGSFSGLAPAPYLSVYGATKSFLKSWSLSLSNELKQYNIHVEHLNTYFVVTAMTKMKRSTLTIPTAKAYVQSAVKGMGKFVDRTPYSVHAVMYWIIGLIPTSTMVDQMGKLLLSMRVRALKKRSLAAKSK